MLAWDDIHASGKVRREKPISTAEFAFLAPLATARGLAPKVTLPSPPTMHFWRGRAGIDPAVYDGAEARNPLYLFSVIPQRRDAFKS